MPKVTTSVIDLSTRISSTGTYNSAIVVAAKKGPVDTPTLVTSQTDFLEKFTPDEVLEVGWDTALYEAYIYLAQQSNLYVVRAANTTTTPALYGGCKVRTYKSELDNEPLDHGFAAITEHTPEVAGMKQTDKKHYDVVDEAIDWENDAMIIYSSSQGAFANDLSVEIITDPRKVKLDGAFLINVYKKGVLVEAFTCSLDPSLKNGYGVNCFAETILESSKYIRADVNDDEDVLKDNSYQVAVNGSALFENEVTAYIEAVKKDPKLPRLPIERIHPYAAGELVKVAELDGADGYYKCIVAGRTATEEDAPVYTEAGGYKQVVNDGDATFRLVEVIRPYAIDTDYNKGEIVSIVKGAETLYYRAKVSGTTGNEQPAFLPTAYIVEDGQITWTNQKQTVNTLSVNGYTYLKKQQGASLDLSKYSVYETEYLASKIELPAMVEVENPTLADARIEEKEVTYVAVYTGKVEEERYRLPKEGKVALAGGFDGAAPTNVENIRALKTLKNVNDINVQLIMDGGNTTPAFQRAIDEVCDYREQSCKGIISTPFVDEVASDAQAKLVHYRNYELNANTRNLELYTTHQLVYDEFNDRNIYVSPSCFVASRIMSVAQEYGWHWAAAGYNRGVINSLDVAATFDPSEVDTFSDAQINTIIKEPGMGNVIFDELTLLNKACDLQDAHITRYVDIYLRPRLKTALKQYLFEFNDETTRMLITKMLETFMAPEKSARAVYDYRVVCDETNNKPRDIQNNTLNCWLFIQVVHLAKWIKQSVIISPYGVSFDDLSF